MNRVNIRIREGEFVAVVGPSGSGKSTLLHLLAGLDRPSAGAVFIRGQDITAMDDDTLARFRGEYVGVVFQEHNLIPQFTALENILIPTMMCRKPDTAYEENLKKLVGALGIADRLHHLPAEMSGGQRQRGHLSTCRTLCLPTNRPAIWIVPMPTKF